MSSPLTAARLLDNSYLEIRARMLDLAAMLDRLEAGQSAEEIATDPRLELIRRGLQIVASSEPERARRFQLLFSDAYEEGWNRQR